MRATKIKVHRYFTKKDALKDVQNLKKIFPDADIKYIGKTKKVPYAPYTVHHKVRKPFRIVR